MTLGLLQDQVRAGAALVLVTHDPTVARRADRIVRLAAGRVDDAPSPADLAARRWAG